MSEWTPEAQDYLEGYLQQVGALARHGGDDASDIVENLRDHIRREAASEAGTFVTLERLRQVIAIVGAPEQVVEMDFPKVDSKMAPEAPVASLAEAPPSSTPPPTTVIYAPPETSKARGMSLGCVLAIIVFPFMILVLVAIVGILAAITLPALNRAREGARLASCQNNLKQVGLVLRMYATENDGAYPALSADPGKLMFDTEGMEELLSDATILNCPTSSTVPADSSWEGMVDDHDYYYLSHILRNEEEGLAYVEAYRQAVHEKLPLDQDIELADGTTLYRITEERIYELGLSGAEVPVVFDNLDNHLPGGSNVLYLDGHTEFHMSNTKFPVTTAFLEAMEGIDQ